MAGLLPHMVDEVASRSPERQAIGCLDASLSYGELAERSTQLANVLLEDGVISGDRVGIYMDKRLQSAVAMYGIMKAGAAYVPIDPALPASRFLKVVNDCGMRHLVSAPEKKRRLRAASLDQTNIESLVGIGSEVELPVRTLTWEDVATASSGSPQTGAINGDTLAYIIYTSGSTGEPKGIMHSHRSGLSFARWAATEYGLRADDRLSNHAPLHFDLSILDYFAGAAAGATTVIVPEEYTKLPASYAQLLEDQGVTVFYTVPFALIQLLLRGELAARDLSKLRWIIFGGEPFPTGHLRSLMRELPQTRFDNIYGPAEVNGVTHYTVPSVEDVADSVPIGPISSIASAIVVDRDDVPVKVGDIGELLVCTPTMMQGYWERPDLNAAAFYTAAGNDAVYYRTGDLVREGPRGIFDFLGRKDRQVKVRGFRVELDEVESVLAAFEGVEEAAAFVLEDNEGSHTIHGAVTLNGGGEQTVGELIVYAKEHLPWYAVPTEMTIRDRFPRTSTGKIDKRILHQQAQAR